MSTNPFKNARVTRQVFIGDRKAKNLSIEELISMIETEAKRSNHLTNLQIESDAIQKLIDQHEQNIADLSTILTERLKEEQDA